MNPNHRIIDTLTHIADSYRSQGVPYKYKAYRTAIDAIRSLGTPITDVAQISSLPGIGKAMVDKVREILATGALQQEKDVMSDPITQAIQTFTSIHGIGPVLAKKLVHENALRTIDDLEASSHLLPPQARLGLKYAKDTALRVPYDEIEDHLTYLKKVVAKLVDPMLQICVCGSHRRGGATSGDIDVLITHPSSSSDSGSEYVFLHVIVGVLRDVGYIIDVLAEGTSKFMGYSRLNPSLPVRRLDMRWMPYDVFFPALLYFTGSDMFNITMRVEALRRGYSLNEYGLYEIPGYEHLHHAPAKGAEGPPAGAAKGKRVFVDSEKAIFDLVGMAYVQPPQRSK